MLNHSNIDDDTSQIDDINLKIINILKSDSSTSFVDIAKRIGVSHATVHMRVRRMMAAGIINKFTISVDKDRLGYDHLAFMGINISPGSADQIVSDLLSCIKESNPRSILSILTGEIIVTFVLNRCFIISDIPHSIFTSVVLSLAMPNISLNEESCNKY